MVENNIDNLIEVNKKLLDETLAVKKELIRIRSKMETTLYKVATKYNVINNDILVVKNKYRGSIKCYKANNLEDGYVDFK